MRLSCVASGRRSPHEIFPVVAHDSSFFEAERGSTGIDRDERGRGLAPATGEIALDVAAVLAHAAASAFLTGRTRIVIPSK